MGIESDQVVYEYLSRVGDIAQQRQLPSATRMRLVSELRGEIERHRAKATVDSPAAVRRILDRLGTPDEVVAAAGGGSGAGRVPQPTSAAVPVQPAPAEPERRRKQPQEPAGGDGDKGGAGERRKGLRRVVPRPRPSATEAASAPSVPRDAPSPPHLAPAHELGDSAVQPDWWRLGGNPFGVSAETDSVPGFVGGVEIPELLRRPPKEKAPAERAEPEEAAEPEPDA